MWFTKKKIEKWIEDNKHDVFIILDRLGYKIELKKEEPTKEEQKPVERKCIMEIILVNNKTDKEYSIKSENDFGLSWDFTQDKDKNNIYRLLMINQKLTIDGSNWKSAGRFTDFSILKCNWQTFKIEN